MSMGAFREVNPAKIAVYIRWSTDDQTDGTTLEVQLDGCRHYVMSQGWVMSENLTFIDDGQSGATLDRPALKRLREAVKRGDVDGVVVYKLDRLSRNVLDLLRLVLEEWDGLSCVRSAREPVDTDTQAGKMFFYTLASFAEWERSVIRERTLSGKIRRAEEGKNPGMRPPYGYRAGDVPGTFEIVPAEAELVRRIYRMYLGGMGARRIVENLNNDGLTFREGRPWTTTTVMWALDNPAFKGDLVYGGRKRNKRRKNAKARSDFPQIVRAGAFPPIVTIEEWEQVQLVRKTRPSPKTGQSGRGYSSEYLLTGLLRCGCCNSSMKVARGTGAPGGGYYWYYTCAGVEERGRGSCQSRSVRQEVLDSIVVEHLKELYSALLREQHTTSIASEAATGEEQALRSSLSEVENLMAKIEARRKKLRTMVLDQQINMDEYRQFVGDIEGEISGLEFRRERVQLALDRLMAARKDRARLLQELRRVDGWDNLSRTEQKALLRAFVERIEAYIPFGGTQLECSITWRVAETKQEAISVEVVRSKHRPAPAAVNTQMPNR